MNLTIVLAGLAWNLIGRGIAAAGVINLSPDEQGDRIAVVKDGSLLTTCVNRVSDGMRFGAVSWRPQR